MSMVSSNRISLDLTRYNDDVLDAKTTNGETLADFVNRTRAKVTEIEDSLAEIWLLGNIEQPKDVYSMSYEEYMELPGRVRL